MLAVAQALGEGYAHGLGQGLGLATVAVLAFVAYRTFVKGPTA